MTPRARRAVAATAVSAAVLVAAAVGAVSFWTPGQQPKQMAAETDAGVDPDDQVPVDPHIEAADAAARADLALAAAQAQTLALSAEVARLRWLASATRRACVQPPPEVAVAEPPPDPPIEPIPDPPAEPIVLAEAPPPPAFTPVRERAPAPPPPPDPPPDPPQVAIIDTAPPPPTADPEFDSRIRREGGQQSDQLVTLIWNNTNDLDLHVVCPTGERVYFANIAACGSQLDIDMNASANRLSTAPVENIVWPRGLPHGRYQVYVDHYANHGSRDPTQFRVRVRVMGDERTFNGSVRHGEPPRFITDFFIN